MCSIMELLADRLPVIILTQIQSLSEVTNFRQHARIIQLRERKS
jgi:hypothetical protein